MIKRIFKILSKALPFLNMLLIIIPLICSHIIPEEWYTKWMSISLVIIVAIIALITYSVAERNVSIERAQNKLSVEILEGERSITKNRRDLIFEGFKNVVYKRGGHQKLNYSPYEKIAFILEAISRCFETYLEIREKYVSVTVFYRFIDRNLSEWNRIDKNYCKAYNSNVEVMNCKDSFGRYVMEGTEGFYLINDKYKDGQKKNRYKLNEKDTETKERFRKYGSIIGSKMTVKIDDKEYIQALLTISTYGKKIDNIPFGIFRENLECKIEDDILPVFKLNIESELMQIYMEEMEKKSD